MHGAEKIHEPLAFSSLGIGLAAFDGAQKSRPRCVSALLTREYLSMRRMWCFGVCEGSQRSAERVFGWRTVGAPARPPPADQQIMVDCVRLLLAFVYSPEHANASSGSRFFNWSHSWFHPFRPVGRFRHCKMSSGRGADAIRLTTRGASFCLALAMFTATLLPSVSAVACRSCVSAPCSFTGTLPDNGAYAQKCGSYSQV